MLLLLHKTLKGSRNIQDFFLIRAFFFCGELCYFVSSFKKVWKELFSRKLFLTPLLIHEYISSPENPVFCIVRAKNCLKRQTIQAQHYCRLNSNS